MNVITTVLNWQNLWRRGFGVHKYTYTIKCAVSILAYRIDRHRHTLFAYSVTICQRHWKRYSFDNSTLNVENWRAPLLEEINFYFFCTMRKHRYIRGYSKSTRNKDNACYYRETLIILRYVPNYKSIGRPLPKAAKSLSKKWKHKNDIITCLKKPDYPHSGKCSILSCSVVVVEVVVVVVEVVVVVSECFWSARP